MQLLPSYRSTLAMRLLALAFLFSSCYTYTVATHAQAGSEYEKPVTAHSFFGGWRKSHQMAFVRRCAIRWV